MPLVKGSGPPGETRAGFSSRFDLAVSVFTQSASHSGSVADVVAVTGLEDVDEEPAAGYRGVALVLSSAQVLRPVVRGQGAIHPVKTRGYFAELPDAAS